MKVVYYNNVSFQRRLKSSEKADYTCTLEQAKQKIGNTGHSVLIMPSISLPHGLDNNTGCGNMLSKESKDFFDFAKQYWGINYVQLLPEGNFAKHNGYKPYSGSSLDLGVQLINLDLLTTDEYGELLNKDDIQNVINANKNSDKDIYVNIENTLDKDSGTDKALRKAYEELKRGNSDKKKELLSEIKQYELKNEEWIERKSVFNILKEKNGTADFSKWSYKECNLYNSDLVTPDERKAIINELKSSELNKEGDFYVFKQFLADKHLGQARKELNSKNIKLSGDMIIGCSSDETWMFPKAFYKDKHLPWGLKAVNFDTQEGIDFLKLKVKNYANRYDGLRIDAGWLYSKQLLECNDSSTFREYHSKILDIIDNEILNVKGKDFDLQNIMYEFEANPEIYSIYSNNQLKDEVINRLKIYKSDYLSEGWDSVSAFKERGWKDGSYIIGATNHDSESLRNLYMNTDIRNEQIKVLSKILKIPETKLQSFSQFEQAKFAEPMRSMHNMVFFSDALNMYENYYAKMPNEKGYRLKIPHNYQDNYFKALEKNEGFNIMDAMQKAFEAEGLDKTEPELYKKIKKYNAILKKKEFPFKKFIIAGIVLKIITTAVVVFVVRKKHKEKNQGTKL